MLMQKWESSEGYIGKDFSGYYIFLRRFRDSDIVEQSNFPIGLDMIGGESETVIITRATHWAVGWVEHIMIHESDQTAIDKAEDILVRLEDYPILDDEDFSAREVDEANSVWLNCYSNQTRIAYIREHRDWFNFDDMEELIMCARGLIFNGYHSELLAVN